MDVSLNSCIIKGTPLVSFFFNEMTLSAILVTDLRTGVTHHAVLCRGGTVRVSHFHNSPSLSDDSVCTGMSPAVPMRSQRSSDAHHQEDQAAQLESSLSCVKLFLLKEAIFSPPEE